MVLLGGHLSLRLIEILTTINDRCISRFFSAICNESGVNAIGILIKMLLHLIYINQMINQMLVGINDNKQ